MKANQRETDERSLIEAAQKDPARFADLYENNFERVYAFVVSRVRHREEAEDLTADVFHQALASIGRFEWRGVPFAAWLLRIAANAVADHWQRTPREHGNPVQNEPYVSWEEVEYRARLFRLVDTLLEDQRAVVIKRFVEQKSISEVAREIQKTEGAVKQLQLRALRNLRARIGETHG
ncbi:sigma-70 family RNA polymerase sigma factor [bacterium]|nr:sigma-70 family RNA polymerase sigma factor [bacterium]